MSTLSPNNTPMERARRAAHAAIQTATRGQGNAQLRMAGERIQLQRANINKRLNELNEHYNDLKFSTGPFGAVPRRNWGINNFRKLNKNAAKLHSELRSTNLIRISNERKAKLANIRRYAKNQLEGWESNNNNSNARANLNIMAQELGNRLSNLQRRQTNLSRLPMGPPGRWNALGQDAESLYDFIRNHNLTSRAREQGVQSALNTIISDATAYRARALASRANSNNNTPARANLNIMAQELGNRLSNLQRRQTNLSRTPGDGRAPPHPSHWNALGQDAESLYDFIRNHNLTSRAREQGVQSAIAVIISDAIAYSNNYYNRNSGSNNNNRNGNNNNNSNNNARTISNARANSNNNNNNNNNYNNNTRARMANEYNRMVAGNIGHILNTKANNFKKNTKWGVRARNNAGAWYNTINKKLRRINTNVISNFIGGNVYKPSQLNTLYFDANAKGNGGRKLYTKNTIVKSGGVNPATSTIMVPRLLPNNVKLAINQFMRRRGMNATKQAKRNLPNNATKNAIKKKALEIYNNV